MRNTQVRHREHGFGYLFAMLFMIIFSGLAFFIITMAGNDFQIARNDYNEKIAYYAAEYGLLLARQSVATKVDKWSSVLDGTDCAAASAYHEIPTQFDTLELKGLSKKGAVICDATLGPLYDIQVGRAKVRVYARNDVNDPSASPTIDQNDQIWLIAVGYVEAGGRTLARKVLAIMLRSCFADPNDIHNTETVYQGLGC